MRETTGQAQKDVEQLVAHRELDVGEVRLHVAEAGAGRGRPLVILLHGFPEFWWSWRKQIKGLAEMGFHVAAPDLRGYNLSEKPKAVSAYDIGKLTGDVRGLIKALGADKAVIVGHDWGGGIAWEFAARYPEMVQRLAVLNCPHPRRLMGGLRSFEQLKKSWYMFFFQLPFLPERVLVKDNCAFVAKTFAKDGFSKEEIAKYVEAFGREGVARSAVNYYRAMMRGSIAGRGPSSARIDAPTLVIWGDKDSYLSVDLAEPPKDQVPNARVELVPGATHWVQHDAPARVNELLIEFIADLKTGGRPS